MTAVKDPYPETLDDIEFNPPGVTSGPSMTPEVRALNRIALALEQLTVLIADRSQPVQNAPQLAALPPVRSQVTVAQNGGVCPIHGTPWKTVPAGISKKTGKPYDAFQACSTQGCDQRPPR